MKDMFEYPEQTGNELIERMQERIDSVNSAKLKAEAIDATIAQFETLARKEERALKLMIEIMASRSKHISKEQKEDSFKKKKEAENNLDLWYTFIDKVKLIKGNMGIPKPAEPKETPTTTNTDRLKAEIKKYGFFDRPKVNALDKHNQQILIEFIDVKGIPYSIAMLSYLGFIEHLKNNYFSSSDTKMYDEIARWFNTSNRTVKGNVATLNPKSKEDKKRYTAHNHKEEVENEYQLLK